MSPLASLPDDYRVTDEALLAETTSYDPPSFLWMFSLLLKDLINFLILIHIGILAVLKMLFLQTGMEL